MKRLILLFLTLTTLVISSNAQNIKHQVVRTPEAPGYFALKVSPGEDLPPLQVQTLFVENYANKAERKRYQDLTTQLSQSGAQVVSATQAVPYVDQEDYQLVLIGGPQQSRWLQFTASKKEDIPTAFADFSKNYLGPIYLMNLTAEFGGNATEVRPQQVPFLKDQSVYFVGQFEKPMKTRVSLNAETPDSLLQADGVMDLTTYDENPVANILEQIWNDLNPAAAKSLSIQRITTDAFPLIFLVLGGLLIWLSLRGRKFETVTDITEEINDDFWHAPLEETPLYQDWEKHLPWEFPDEVLRRVQV